MTSKLTRDQIINDDNFGDYDSDTETVTSCASDIEYIDELDEDDLNNDEKESDFEPGNEEEMDNDGEESEDALDDDGDERENNASASSELIS